MSFYPSVFVVSPPPHFVVAPIDADTPTAAGRGMDPERKRAVREMRRGTSTTHAEGRKETESDL